MGKYAVDLIRNNINGVVIGVDENQLVHIPIEQALNMVKRPDNSLTRLINRIK